MRRTAVFICLLLGLGLMPYAALAQDYQCFPETGFCISGKIRAHWEKNGGLPVFGFPINTASNEVNRDTGQTYLTQWFQRNRFEVHPENAGTPYEVLLGRLGDDRLIQQGRPWHGLPKGDPAAPHYFPATGHAIASQFWGYWSSHGLDLGQKGVTEQESLALFGLPISEPAMETNSSGDTVLTQWFERARFEWHPQNQPPYDVLLGLLGNEVGAPPAPPPSYNNCQADPYAGQAPNYPIRITAINKSTEVVTLHNAGTTTIDLTGWIMCSITGNQRHDGIVGAIAAGETRSYPYVGSGTIWNNSEKDDGALYDPSGRLMSYWND